MEQGRDVFCIPPADIFDKRYMGVIKYLRDGAFPCLTDRDIVYEYYTSHAHMIGAGGTVRRGSDKSESSVMTLGEAEAKPKTPAKKPQVSVPEPPAEAEPDPGTGSHAGGRTGRAGRRDPVPAAKAGRDAHGSDRSGTGSFYGGTDHHADRTGTVREIGTPAGKTIPVHALRLSCVCSLRTNLEKKQL